MSDEIGPFTEASIEAAARVLARQYGYDHVWENDIGEEVHDRHYWGRIGHDALAAAVEALERDGKRLVAVDVDQRALVEQMARDRYESTRAMPGMREHWPPWESAAMVMQDTYRSVAAGWAARTLTALGCLPVESSLCRCVFQAHCDRRSGCRLVAGGTVNEGGGICGSADSSPEE